MSGRSDTPIHDDTKLPALTGLRFFAAFAVLLSHFDHRSLVSVPTGLTDFLDGGRTAVSLFFVLSGFILAYNYSGMSGRTDRWKFYASRIARIYPVTLLALALGAVGVIYALVDRGSGVLLDWFALKDANFFNLGGSLFAQLTMTTGWFPTASINQPWNSPAWSISCEMFFYAVFPVLIGKLRTWTMRRSALVLGSAFVFQVLIICASRAFAPTGQKGFLVSQFPLTHLFEFLVGIMAAVLFMRGGREWISIGHRRALMLIATVIPIVLLSFFRPVAPAYLLMSPMFAILILAFAVSPKRGRSFFAWSPIILLGEASFSLYMVHVPLMNLYSIAHPQATVGWLLMAVTVCLSVVVFRWFETPARIRMRSAILRFAPRPAEARHAELVTRKLVR